MSFYMSGQPICISYIVKVLFHISIRVQLNSIPFKNLI